ncbi:MAG: rod shape-determining protein MreC [Pseudomonadota bacterium]|nr:rod shape-determining protein MreC [Pseudomonadota bacterium]
MKHHTASVTKLTIPVKAWLNRFALLLLFLLAFTIMLLGKAESLAVEKIRSGVTDFIVPIMDGLSRPIATVSAVIDQTGNLFSVYEENERLREQNARLLEWQSSALALAAENSALRKVLNFVPERDASFAAARVIGDSGRVFVQSVLINAGSGSGIARGNAVVTGGGLVGRISEAGRRSARVLLITDLNSRIPVVSEKGRIRAILSGDNSSTPKLGFLSPNAGINLGDRFVTSGHGGVFPAGLPIGKISSVEDGVLRVAPFANFDSLEYVRIITDFAGKVPDTFVPTTVRQSRMK